MKITTIEPYKWIKFRAVCVRVSVSRKTHFKHQNRTKPIWLVGHQEKCALTRRKHTYKTWIRRDQTIVVATIYLVSRRNYAKQHRCMVIGLINDSVGWDFPFIHSARMQNKATEWLVSSVSTCIIYWMNHFLVFVIVICTRARDA